ncbi:MAG: family 10 glycosylhydrolase, partial [Oscillospiraceae bacterium]
MKKYQFTFRMLSLAICTAIAISLFYVPKNDGVVQAEFSELRGVWISTVGQLDYPSKNTTDPNTLKNDMISILDNCQDMGFNSVFFQVRPSGDALYKSSIFPWSKYISGTQGVAPADGFDPLAFAVDEAHKRGMELHAWINPYRVTNSPSDNSKLAESNPAVQNPALTFTASDGKIHYNPGESAAIDLIIKGAVEIAENYDVDGIHMDDYFYPSASFDDSGTYAYYKDQYPDCDNWRRSMVDTLVREMDTAVHAVKPNIQFGISPAGIWANSSTLSDGSNTNGSQTFFNGFADTKGWVEKGYVDYIMPQIYWNIGYKAADYTTLLHWWSNVVSKANNGVKLYIGEGAYRTTSSPLTEWKGENGTNELRTHINMGREDDGTSGYCMFTYNTFTSNPSIYSLMQEVNATPSTKLDNGETPAPTAKPEPTEAPKPTETPTPTVAPTEKPTPTEKPDNGEYV